MKVKLTLQEKLRDLRDERKLKLQDIADATGIPLATLGRIESKLGTVLSGYLDKDTFFSEEMVNAAIEFLEALSPVKGGYIPHHIKLVKLMDYVEYNGEY